MLTKDEEKRMINGIGEGSLENLILTRKRDMDGADAFVQC